MRIVLGAVIIIFGLCIAPFFIEIFINPYFPYCLTHVCGTTGGYTTLQATLYHGITILIILLPVIIGLWLIYGSMKLLN